LSAVGIVAFALAAYCAIAVPCARARITLALCAGVVLGGALLWLSGQVAPPVGLKASYWAGAQPNGLPERSTDFPWLTDATRIEPGLELKGEQFGVHFFNDASRFNFGPEVQPGRDQLPFSVRWDGWLLAPSDGPRRFVLQANGTAQMALDGVPIAADATIDLSAGLHALQVGYARPEAQVPSLVVRWQREPGGALEAIGGEDVRWKPDSGSTNLGRMLNGLGSALIGAAIIAWMALGASQLWRRRNPAAVARAGLGLLPLAFLGHGMLLEAPSIGRATILSGLDDWLIYESSARDILLNGPLMNGGQGHVAPFYGQPLYPYVLALAHRLTGESLFGPIVLQFAALGLVAVGTAVLARRAFSTLLDGLVAAAALVVLLQLEPEHFKIARQLFNENLYMPLVMASLIALVTLASRRAPTSWWRALLVGVLLGLTAISRSQFLLCVPFGLLILWLAWRERPRMAAGMVCVIAAGVVLTIAPVTARNLIVSGQLVPISSSGGASLLEFHRPPPGLIDQSAIDHDPLFDALHLDASTRTVIAFIRADPRGYAATLLPLGAHSIGLPGRNDPGIYWPLLVTVLLYAASFGLRRTRRLHAWPIHVFVFTHVLVLTLFEADTYGYRLVMPMYAPMVAVAAQLPLEGLRRTMRTRAGAGLRSGDSARAVRFAAAGWGALLAAALLWQAKGLVDVWPNRDPALHGLGGAAAHAALASDATGANAIYIASVDGTPRRFGAGSLPGLRYPWFKWFDPTRSVPLPPVGDTAVYMLSELVGHSPAGDLTSCLGTPDANAEVVVDAARAQTECGLTTSGSAAVAVFDGVAQINAVQARPSTRAGDPLQTELEWQPLVSHPSDAYQVSLQLDDPTAGDGIQWGNGTVELYPSSEWTTGENLVSRIPVATDATALPETYRLTLGISPMRPNAQPAMATWQGARTDRVPVANVALTPGSVDVGAALPPDMRPLEGPPLTAGGLELLGARPLPAEADVGSPLRIGLLWRAVQDQPSARQLTVRLVSASGEVVQESVLPVLGGRVAPSALHAGNVVRDEQTVVIDSRAPAGEPVSVALMLADTPLRLGSISLTGRPHAFDTSGSEPIATFGGSMALLSGQLSPSAVHGGDKVNVQLRWRGLASMSVGYKVFVHVLDPSGGGVVAQHDAEPQEGKAPTTGWLVNEVIDDAYTVGLPSALAAGTYPVEVGVYDPRSGDRLTLPDGSNRFILDPPLTVQ
jgi:Dolichyl-phosphate-mannose-protein mannosyltransferase